MEQNAYISHEDAEAENAHLVRIFLLRAFAPLRETDFICLFDRAIIPYLYRGITMASVKTAISIDAKLFKSVEKHARKLGVSRSRFFADAAAAYLSRFDHEAIVEQINRAVEIAGQPVSPRESTAMRQAFARAVGDDKW
jgi:hypothetical protein